MKLSQSDKRCQQCFGTGETATPDPCGRTERDYCSCPAGQALKKAVKDKKKLEEGFYFLNSGFIKERGLKNHVCWGYFDTFEEAEVALKENWDNMHEFWNNVAFIEFVPKGYSPHDRVSRIRRGNLFRKWFKEVVEDKVRTMVPMEEPKTYRNIGLLSI